MDKKAVYSKVCEAIISLKKRELKHKLETAIETIKKSDPKTKLPGTLLDKNFGPAPGPANKLKDVKLTKQPKMKMPKIKTPGKSQPGLKMSEHEGINKCWKTEKGAKFLKYMKKCSLNKSWGLKKDDKPHKPGTPEYAAHEVAEHKAPIAAELKHLDSNEKKKMFEHLRTLKDKSEHRSPENKK